MTSRIIAADWVVPVAWPPIRDGAVVIDGTHLSWVGPVEQLPNQWDPVMIESRHGVITPGLVNAHTHLQYTHFDQIGTGTFTSFEHWSNVFGDVYNAVADPAEWHSAAVDGVHQAVATGTTVLAEIVTNDQARGALNDAGVAGIEYLEAIGLFEKKWHNGARAEFLSRLEQTSPSRCGVSPHAAYSLDGSVITDLIRIAQQHGMRVHSHLGESSVEANLYGFGDNTVLGAYGDLRDEFELVRRGGTGHTTAGYADTIGLLTPTTHVAHGIYLDRDDRNLLLARETQVALCPRSNAVIGLADPPVADYLHEGHEIAVGTDSLASSPSLDLMSDVHALARIARRQGYQGEDLHRRLIHAATFGGALAMGLDGEGYGTLVKGGPADLALFNISVDAEEVERALVERGEGTCVLTISGGKTLHNVATRQRASAAHSPSPNDAQGPLHSDDGENTNDRQQFG